MKLSPHFTLLELTKSDTATRLGIDQTPPEAVLENLRRLCVKVLEPVRAHFKRPIRINSGYRSPALNKAVNGTKNSQHLMGYAADIEISGVSNLELGNWIRKNLDFDQVIFEFCKKNDPSAGWIHVSFVGEANRKAVVEIK